MGDTRNDGQRDGRAALIGLGEVGRVFAEDLRGLGLTRITAWDVALEDPRSAAARNHQDLALAPAATAAEALGGARFVVSAVTASACVPAARAAAAVLTPGAWFFDLNSASPGHKVEAATLVDEAGGRYVEAALMSPIGPRRTASPFLLGGPHAQSFAAEAAAWGLTDVSVASETVGRPAATKLCRSVIVKGLEALLTESLLAARTYGVENEVLASLGNILPEADWEAVAGYFVSRSLQHGRRRAEEMQEAAATVAEAGIDPWMSEATVRRQAWAAQFSAALAAEGTIAMVDAVIDALHTNAGDIEIR